VFRRERLFRAVANLQSFTPSLTRAFGGRMAVRLECRLTTTAVVVAFRGGINDPLPVDPLRKR
jgi:hypothetical protein